MNSYENRPFIGLSMGDPLGIGPEILVQALSDPDIYAVCRPLVLGDPGIMARACDLLSGEMTLHGIETPDQGRYEPGCIDLVPLSTLSADVIGLSTPTPDIGKAMEIYITRGTTLALDKKIDALVTCPITKTGLKMAGSRFHGHTEMIANQTRTSRFAMMMAGPRLKVVLVTIHIPLNDVAMNLTMEKVLETIRLTHTALETRFGITRPRLAAAGLNPHAGEDALFGQEEQRLISPALDAACRMGVDIRGPLPPDTVFFQAMNGKYDAVIAMYHDQGLIPFKLVHFRDGVNTTIGLPIIRTSVDHGTAYDIAWQGKADPSSLKAAIHMAVHQALARTDRTDR